MTEIPKPRFGDIIENGWASEDNPTRIGFFVREGKRTGHMNAGRYYEVTDGAGKFWELSPFGDHKITIRPKDSARPLMSEGEGVLLSQPLGGAAPDLLNACQAMVRMYEGATPPGDLTPITSARAAKALGSNPKEPGS